MAQDSRKLYKVGVVHNGGITKYRFYRVGRARLVRAEDISEYSHKRFERAFGLAIAGSTDCRNLEIYTFTYGMSVSLWLE